MQELSKIIPKQYMPLVEEYLTVCKKLAGLSPVADHAAIGQLKIQ